MMKITVYTTDYCHLNFEEIDVSAPDAKAQLKARTGWRTVPQIFIGEELIGGYQELAALDRSGDLAKKLAPKA